MTLQLGLDAADERVRRICLFRGFDDLGKIRSGLLAHGVPPWSRPAMLTEAHYAVRIIGPRDADHGKD
ncbi:hypothetical protein GCM10022226_35910 [Sphaerisporangium flaviroseum]|uniref:Uncharacterized protein n=1 Tax=Sphaerisporangium flaviroseum TaxID=509199 RepID=A0ABP7I889_9ACTN